MDWREEPIGRHHDRRSFDCSAADLKLILPLSVTAEAIKTAGARRK